MSKAIMDALFAQADLKCTACGASRGQCDCWEKCSCGWSKRKGGKCNNVECGGDGVMTLQYHGKLPWEKK